jgi:outer membrane protein assembly factor BamB
MPVFHNDRVYVAHGGDIWWGKNEAWLKCIDATQSGDVTGTGCVWSYPLERHCCSTPAIADGLVYMADYGRHVHCVDAQTGEPYWKERTRGEIFGSTLVADGKVYVGTRRGNLWVFEAGREKRILATIDLGSGMMATPVAANGALYIASMKTLYAVAQRP